jgi:serine/threonine protein kinase
MNSLIGHSLGRYHILEKLGEGGMAVVYKAFDTHTETEVAVKVIRADLFGSTVLKRVLKRFEREGKALAKLSHPNIVNVIDYGEHETTPYLVMPFIPSGTLKGKLGKPVPWQDAFTLILPIAQALEYTHKKGIIHRDIKPSNILINASGEPMLSDFGIAKILEGDEGSTLSTTTGVGIGTPEYMSPEQGLGHEVDARADIYSLGIVLYELITGRKPFRADTPMAVIVKHINDPLPSPKQYVRDLPDTVERVLLKALSKKPEDRFRSMAEFGRALDALLEPIRARERAIANEAKEKLRREVRVKAQEKPPERKQITNTPTPIRSSWMMKAGIFLSISLGIVLIGAGQLNRLQIISQPTTTFSPTTSFPTALFTSTVPFTPTFSKPWTLTPTATPVYIEGNVLFEDDFEDNDLSKWTSPVGSPSTWSIQQEADGNQVLVGSPQRESEISISHLNGNWADYVLEMEFNIMARAPASRGIEIAFRIHNPCHNYIAGFGDWWFIGSANGCGTFMQFAVDTPYAFQKMKWYALRIELYQSQISLYVNDNHLHSFENTDHERGGISLIVINGTEVYFDNIRVVELVSR